MNNCWINGDLKPVAEASVSVMDHGLLYGDGIFEGLRFYNGVIFKLKEHLIRLEMSAKAIGLNIPYDREQLTEAMLSLLSGFSEPNGYIRLVVTRGVGKLGIDPSNCEKPSVFIIADGLAMISDEARQKGISLITASTRRLPVDGLDPRVKSLNYLNHILARMEANAAGVDDAILLNQQGLVTEASVANVFIVRQGILMTPPVSDGALDGITRESVIEVAIELGTEVKECSITQYDLYTADECFLTGTGAELIPVSMIDGRVIGQIERPEYQRLQLGFWALVDRCCV